MARIAYDDLDAAAFAANRHVADDGLSAWRDAVGRHLQGRRLVDLGAGTGWWASAFCRWYHGIDVIAIEPSAAMRARSDYPRMVAGDAANLPLADGSVDVAWLSTVIHHLPDLPAAARELRRVLRPGGKVLIRSAFAGRPAGITLFRYFPEAIRILDTYPSVADVETALSGFTRQALEPVRQITAPSLRDAAANLRRAAEVESGPVVDALDLLVLKGA